MTAIRDPGPRALILPDRQRLHLQHGPIDLIIQAEGTNDAVIDAYNDANDAFQTVLRTLVGEIDLLRFPTRHTVPPKGEIANAMWRATLPYRLFDFVTPMAAVAGAVADHMLSVMVSGNNLHRAYVNNGGDIAISLGERETFDIAVCSNPTTGETPIKLRLSHGDGIGGIATSGWRGRSHSLGIADAVTVLASNAAQADVAATMIGNAVNLPDNPQISRAPARDLVPDSDLGHRLVTTEVPSLTLLEVSEALDRGAAAAETYLAAGHFTAAFLYLQGKQRIVAAPAYLTAMNDRGIPCRT